VQPTLAASNSPRPIETSVPSLGYKGPVEIFLAFLATSQAARLLVRVKDIDGRPVMHILAQFKASGELHKMAPADQRENVDSRDACPCGKSDSY
jgi:hypothetical protein